MEIYPLGHASFKIKGKSTTVVTDPYDPKMVGLKFPKIEGVDVVTISHGHQDHNYLPALGINHTAEMGADRFGDVFVASGSGEFEVKGVTIAGVGTFHDEKEGQERGLNTVFRMTIDGINVCHLGDLGHKLSDSQISQIGEVDILFVPVGGYYTIDAAKAAEVVASLEPLVVVPMHYRRAGLAPAIFDKIEGVDRFLKEMGTEGVTALPKFGVTKEKLPENTTVIVLE